MYTKALEESKFFMYTHIEVFLHSFVENHTVLGSIAIYFGKADGKRTEPYPAISAFYCVAFYCVEMSILGGELGIVISTFIRWRNIKSEMMKLDSCKKTAVWNGFIKFILKNIEKANYVSLTENIEVHMKDEHEVNCFLNDDIEEEKWTAQREEVEHLNPLLR